MCRFWVFFNKKKIHISSQHYPCPNLNILWYKKLSTQSCARDTHCQNQKILVPVCHTTLVITLVILAAKYLENLITILQIIFKNNDLILKICDIYKKNVSFLGGGGFNKKNTHLIVFMLKLFNFRISPANHTSLESKYNVYTILLNILLNISIQPHIILHL